MRFPTRTNCGRSALYGYGPLTPLVNASRLCCLVTSQMKRVRGLRHACWTAGCAATRHVHLSYMQDVILVLWCHVGFGSFVLALWHAEGRMHREPTTSEGVRLRFLLSRPGPAGGSYRCLLRGCLSHTNPSPPTRQPPTDPYPPALHGQLGKLPRSGRHISNCNSSMM